MKLPEYDNRPGPGGPLYEEKETSVWDDIKFPLLAVLLPILAVAFFGSAALDLVDMIRAAVR